MDTKVCTACFTEKPIDEFAGRTTCRTCRTEAWKSARYANVDRERHQYQVRLNRIINSLPVLR